jgi:2-methylisocitrate lyase-like PEP mutase family enzyme
MPVPTSYNTLTESVLAGWGANIIVYANHLLRAAYPAMQQTALSILEHRRSAEADKTIAPIKDFLDIIPGQ